MANSSSRVLKASKVTACHRYVLSEYESKLNSLLWSVFNEGKALETSPWRYLEYLYLLSFNNIKKNNLIFT